MTEIEIPATGALPTETGTREEVMQAAIRGRMRELAHELHPDVEGATAPDPRDHPSWGQPDPPPRERHAEAAPVSMVPPTPATRTLIVDGVPHTVTDQQAQELAQIGIVTAQALRDYDSRPQPIVHDEELRATAHRIQYGNEDEAANALGNLVNTVVSRASPRAPDENAIAQRAVQITRQQDAFADATKIIFREYPDIVADRQRATLAAINVEAIRTRNRQAGRQQSDLEVFREAGNAVRSAMGTSPPARGTDTPQPRGNAQQAFEQIRRARGQVI